MGSRHAAAFDAARFASAVASMSGACTDVAPAQPDCLPSGVRCVVEKSESTLFQVPLLPRLFTIATTLLESSRYPAATRPASFATASAAAAFAARDSGDDAAVLASNANVFG